MLLFSLKVLPFVLLWTLCLKLVGAGWLSTPRASKSSDKESLTDVEKRAGVLLPKLLPHEDTSYLIEFHSDNCDHCEQMEPVLQRLERDLDTKIRRINIFRRREFYGLMEAMGHDECGGLPFYYNRRTGQAICGATTYSNLKRWGTGSVKHMFQDAPEARDQDREARPAARKDVGAKQMLVERMQKIGRGKKQTKSAGTKKGQLEETKKVSGDSNKDSKVAGGRRASSAAERVAERRKARESTKAAS